ncbi:laccase, partial [Physocladia obscura]
MSAEAGFQVSIDGHRVTVVEADGSYTNPTVVDSFQITASGRYSIIVNATGELSRYWIRAKMEDMYTPAGSEITNALNMDIRAILQYTDSQVDPTSTPNVNPIVLNTYDLGELNGMTTLTQPRASVNMTLHFTVKAGPAPLNSTFATFTLNSTDGQSFVDSKYVLPSKAPTLKDLMGSHSILMLEEDLGANLVKVQNGSWVLVTIVNTDNVDHTFHLHGHNFYVVSAGNILEATSRPVALTSSFPRRDSIMVSGCEGESEDSCNPGY